MAIHHQQGLADHHHQAAGGDGRSALETFADVGPRALSRFAEATKAQAEELLDARGLQASIASTAGSVGSWASSTAEVLQQPVQVTLTKRPLWVYISSVLAVTYLVLFLSTGPLNPATRSSVLPTPTPVEVRDTSTHSVPSVQATPSHASQDRGSGPSPTPALYEPTEAGIVAEICHLISQVGALTGRTPGAQSLFDFVDAGAENSDRSLSQRLCGSCLSSEAILSALREWRSMGGRARDAAWDAAEVEDRLRTAERASILLHNPGPAAVYDRLFRDGMDSETIQETKQRMRRLCDPFWV